MQLRSYFISLFLLCSAEVSLAKRQEINALYVPLADHYAALIAYEMYADNMQFAEFKLQQMTSWDLLQAKFMGGEADMAFVMAPLALNMYNASPNFRWLGLMHRDGNGLAVNYPIANNTRFAPLRAHRLPHQHLADTFKELTKNDTQILFGVPHLQSTHVVILDHFLKQHGHALSLRPNFNDRFLAIAVDPSDSIRFLNANNHLNKTVAIEQSLPWIDLAETEGVAKVAWYSKDIIKSDNGHVECIAIATDDAIGNKNKAVTEVFEAIKRAGKLIETARKNGGEELQHLIDLIQKHIPAHSDDAIITSLDPHLRIINYDNLEVDKPGLKVIMNFALESGVLKQPVDLNVFSDTKLSANGVNDEK